MVLATRHYREHQKGSQPTATNTRLFYAGQRGFKPTKWRQPIAVEVLQMPWKLFVFMKQWKKEKNDQGRRRLAIYPVTSKPTLFILEKEF